LIDNVEVYLNGSYDLVRRPRKRIPLLEDTFPYSLYDLPLESFECVVENELEDVELISH
jgi:hypothetical protein